MSSPIALYLVYWSRSPPAPPPPASEFSDWPSLASRVPGHPLSLLLATHVSPAFTWEPGIQTQVLVATWQALYPLGCFPACNWFLNEQGRSLWERHTLWETAQHWSHFPSDPCRTLSLPPLPQGTGGEGAHLLQGHRLAARVLTEGIPLGPLSSLSVSLLLAS